MKIMWKLLSLSLVCLCLFPITLVQAQNTDEPTLDDLVFGFYAEDGTLFQPFTMTNEPLRQRIFIPNDLGSESDPIIYRYIWIWVFYRNTTNDPVTSRYFNYTKYEQEDVTEYQWDPIQERNVPVTVKRYTNQVDNGTLRIDIVNTRLEMPAAVRKWDIGFSTISQLIVIQYLNVEIKFYHQALEGQVPQTLTGSDVNIIVFGSLGLAFLTQLFATNRAKWFIDRVIYSYTPPYTGAFITIGIFFAGFLSFFISSLPQGDIIFLQVQMIPAFVILPIIFIAQLIYSAAKFDLENLWIYEYILYGEPDYRNKYRTLATRRLYIYQRQINGQMVNCYLNFATQGDGFVGLLRRFFKKDILIDPRCPLEGSINFHCPDKGITHIDIVDFDSFQIRVPATPRLSLFSFVAGLAATLFGVMLHGVQPVMAVILYVLGIFGILNWSYRAVQTIKYDAERGVISFEVLRRDVIRVLKDEGYIEEVTAYNEDLEEQLATAEATVLKEAHRWGKNIGRKFIDHIISGGVQSVQHHTDEAIADALRYEPNVNLEQLRLPKERKKHIQELLREAKEQEHDEAGGGDEQPAGTT